MEPQDGPRERKFNPRRPPKGARRTKTDQDFPRTLNLPEAKLLFDPAPALPISPYPDACCTCSASWRDSACLMFEGCFLSVLRRSQFLSSCTCSASRRDSACTLFQNSSSGPLQTSSGKYWSRLSGNITRIDRMRVTRRVGRRMNAGGSQCSPVGGFSVPGGSEETQDEEEEAARYRPLRRSSQLPAFPVDPTEHLRSRLEPERARAARAWFWYTYIHTDGRGCRPGGARLVPSRRGWAPGSGGSQALSRGSTTELIYPRNCFFFKSTKEYVEIHECSTYSFLYSTKKSIWG